MTTEINMLSDTSTRPTAGMREAIANAECGDDMVGEDPTVNRLEAMVADMFGKEAAVFACSGTQSNQMGVWAHCQPGDEILIAETAHIANFEGGAPAILSGVTCRTVPDDCGRIDVPQLEGKIRPDNQHFCRTKLVALENTTNLGGGRCYPLEQIERVCSWAHNNGLQTHLDGARFFNAAVATNASVLDIAEHFDTISICFSKGLGCPMGSILVGSSELIYRARRARKVFGGALRQAGIVAAAAVYALENHVERLADDHDNARKFAEAIGQLEGISIDLNCVETNLVFFELEKGQGTATELVEAMKSRGVRLGAVGPQRIRACTHLDLSRELVLEAASRICEQMESGLNSTNATAGSYGAA